MTDPVTPLLTPVPPPIDPVGAGVPAAVAVQPIVFAELERAPTPSPTPAIDPAAAAANPLHGVRAAVRVCVGEAELTVGELMGAREHQVLRLDRRVDEPVDIVLHDQVIARGHLVAVGDQFGIRITELARLLAP